MDHTQFECAFLSYLRARKNEAVSRDQLLVDVWGYPRPVPTRSVDAAVHRVRQKIEADMSQPRHLLTVAGKGYTWWDSGAIVLADIRCCGRSRWSEQLAWAEATFDCALDPHDARVGLSAEIRAAFADETAALSAGARALLDLLCLARAGWTLAELARHGDPSALRGLLDDNWVTVEQGCARLGPLWWPVRTQGEAARNTAVQLWMDRFRDHKDVDLLDVAPAFHWPEVALDQAAELLALATRPLVEEGLFRHLTRACDTLLSRPLSPAHATKTHLSRAKGLFHLGLLSQAQQSIECAVLEAEGAPELLGEALGRSAMIAHDLGELAAAAARFPRAIELTAKSYPWFSLILGSAYARLLWDMGQSEEALSACRRAHAAAVRAGEERPRLDAERTLGRLLLGLGHRAEAIVRLGALLEHYAVHKQPGLACGVASHLGLAHLDLGDLDEGDVWFARGQELVEPGMRRISARLEMGLGFAKALRGEWADAMAYQLRAIVIADDLELDGSATLVLRCWVAVGAHQLGDAALSKSMLQDALDAVESNLDPADRAVLWVACQVLGVEAPDGTTPSGPCLLFERLARRAWGMPARG
jgi:tetratricopeptide (TPR) repeat protein